jgi:hypothetical protein
LNHPELIIVGRSRATAQHILNTIAIGLDDNHRLDLARTTVDLLPGTPCCFLEVSPRYYPDYVGFARTAAASFPSTKSSGRTTKGTTPGIRTPANPIKNGNPSARRPTASDDPVTEEAATSPEISLIEDASSL